MRTTVLTSVLFALLGLLPARAEARYFDPTLGRFVTRDVIGVWGDRANHGSAVAFVGSRPGKFLDPFGLSPYRFDYTPAGLTPAEEALWKESGYFDRLALRRSVKHAFDAAERYGGPQEDSPADAVRHCVLSCELSGPNKHARDRAKNWGDAHETRPWDPTRGPLWLHDQAREMDLHNNECGRDLNRELYEERERRYQEYYRKHRQAPPDHHDEIDCEGACLKALEDGRLRPGITKPSPQDPVN